MGLSNSLNWQGTASRKMPVAKVGATINGAQEHNALAGLLAISKMIYVAGFSAVFAAVLIPGVPSGRCTCRATLHAISVRFINAFT